MVWIINNIGTIVVALVLITIVTLITRGMIADRKKGLHSCGGNCASCKMCCKKSIHKAN